MTGQSDLYSLGIVLYEMLTGEVPFRGDSPVAVAMKHVREEVPDVQVRRPGVSAATAAVVDRAVAKDLARRYPDAASMVSDLEDVLALEASRSGQATGEVTTVLRTLPGGARRRLPWRMRHPARWVGSLALVGVVVALVLIVLAGQTHRGTGTAAEHSTAHGPRTGAAQPDGRPRLQPVRHRPRKPRPDRQRGRQRPQHHLEHRAVLRTARSRSPAAWASGCTSTRPRRSPRKALEIQTPTPGFAVQLYVANHIDLSEAYGSSKPLERARLAGTGWLQRRTSTAANASQLDLGGGAYRYYLVWMTALPPGQQLGDDRRAHAAPVRCSWGRSRSFSS